MDLYLDLFKTERDSLNTVFLASLQKTLSAATFVESGTYLGATTASASPFFKTVITIELDNGLYHRAASMFSGSNVNVYHGDSAEVLLRLRPILQEPVIFWLDGHYSGKGTARGDSNTPVLKEIAAIKSMGLTRWIVLIDDIRLFQPGNSGSQETLTGYPAISDVFTSLKQNTSNVACAVLGDIAMAVCPGNLFRFSPLIDAVTVSRTFNGPDSRIQDVFDAEASIAQAQGRERESLLSLPFAYSSSEKFGIGGHYRLWRGLLLQNKRKYAEAGIDLLQALENLLHWRVSWYCAQLFFSMGDMDRALFHARQTRPMTVEFPQVKALVREIQNRLNGKNPGGQFISGEP